MPVNIVTLRHIIQLAGRDFAQFFEAIAIESARLLGADAAALIVQDTDGMMRYLFFHGLPEAFQARALNYRFSPEEGTVGAAMRQQQPVFTPDYPASPAAMTEFVQFGLKANLVVPIPNDGADQPKAALAVAWFNEWPQQVPGAEQIEFIGLYSDLLQAGLARQTMLDVWKLQANRDTLTGLPNRRALVGYLPVARERAQRMRGNLVVCVMDLDDFKPVNDLFGHAAGDSLLMEMAYRLKSLMRVTDFVARLGGDEFVLVFENTHSIQQIEIALRRIYRAVSQPFELSDGQSVQVGMSLGFTVYPDDPSEPDCLIRHADQALYVSKQHKRNAGVFWRRWQAVDAGMLQKTILPHCN